MMKHLPLAIAFAATLTLISCGASDENIAAPDPDKGIFRDNYDDFQNDIRITAPVANTKVAIPLVVTGEARGTWYNGDSFVVRMVDADGNELVKTVAQAQPLTEEKWGPEDFVPFTATLNFDKPGTATGMLMFIKSNPSGVPQNTGTIAIPVSF